MNGVEHCPCGSGQPYAECCGRFHRGVEIPATPEKLMRSRYSAYVLKLSSYLHATWHPSIRPAVLDVSSDETVWLGLKILSYGKDWVEFVAQYQGGELHERSRFVKEEGQWVYMDGEIMPPLAALKPGRNDPCPCGSGRKYKKCCGR